MHVNPKLEASVQLATITDICGQLKISRTSFYRLARHPGFPSAIRFGRRMVRYRIAEVMSFVMCEQDIQVRSLAPLVVH